MQEVIQQILFYLRGIWRRRWYMIGTAWIVSVIGWAVVINLPDQYEATAMVHADTSSILRPLLKGIAVNKNPDEQIRVVQQTLLSRPNLEKVVRMTDLDLELESEADYEDAVRDLEEDIRFEQAGRHNLYTISYVHDDPEFGRKVVQSLLTLFVENALGDTRQDSDSAKRFLVQQIAEYESRLIEAEQKLKDFKRKNLGLMPGQGQDYFERMQEAQQSYEEAELELRQAEGLAEELRRQVEGEEPNFGITEQSNYTELDEAAIDVRISRTLERLDDLLLAYTDNHPDVISTRQMLAGLYETKKKIVRRALENRPTVLELSENPVYQQLKISLGEAEANVAWLKVRVDTYKKRADELSELVYVLPQVEAEMQALNRDYQVTKNNYDQLLAKREAARLSQEREQTSNDIKFKIVEPPRVPLEPVGPNRILFASLVFVVAIGLGVVIAFIVSQTALTFSSTRELSTVMQMPVLGSVGLTLTKSDVQKRWVQNITFIGLSAGLLLIYVTIVALQLLLVG